MDVNADTPDRLMELPEETRKFLAQLRDDDIATLKDGIELVVAVRTVGRFVKWLVVGVVGVIVGGVMLWESIEKVSGKIWPK